MKLARVVIYNLDNRMDSICARLHAICDGSFVIPASLEWFLPTALRYHDSAHNIEHAIAVFANACQIVAAEQIKFELHEATEFTLAMVCHDVRDHKIKRCLSADTVFSYLEFEVGTKSALRIVHMHANCSWSARRNSLPTPSGDNLRLILQDADWIEALDVGRCIDYTNAIGGTVPDDVCAHIREKLLLIPAELNFESSKQLASERVAALHTYLALSSLGTIVLP